MAVDHYENFPVASLLLPAHLRPAVRDLYAFARCADDLADEGSATPEERLDILGRWDAALCGLARGLPVEASLPPAHRLIFEPLSRTVDRHRLPLEPLHDLLSAFMQDVRVKRYADEAELLDYCRRSANPVGRLMLCLFGAESAHDQMQSDALCTGLQLANFCQDVAIDWRKGRCYIPLSDLARHRVTLEAIGELCDNPPEDAPAAWRHLLQAQIARARHALLAGSPLAWRLPGRIGLELRLVVHGGLRILEKLEADGDNPFARRPTLSRTDGLLLCWRAFCLRRPTPPVHHVPRHEP